ncbi:MAG: rod shape-determining protein MreC [Opitutales bacterium]|nr:rod shape-determining protein MreC [Opitutales bacterium]
MSKNRTNTAILNIVAFAAILIFCAAAPDFARSLAEPAFSSFKAPLNTIPSRLKDLEQFWLLRSGSKTALIEAGRDLARINAGYELRLMENDSLSAKLARYQNMWAMPSDEKFRPEIARVVRRDISAWWQHLVIRKGSASGVEEGDAVVYSGGVVGRVKKVLSADTSLVELLSSRDFRMAARFEGDDRPVIYQGAGQMSFRSARGEVSDVYTDISAPAGRPLRLVASGLAGTFPEGLYIGSVSSLYFDGDRMFKTGPVLLNPELGSLREVAVLVKISRANPAK